MSNSLYDKGREAFLTALIDWSTHTIKVALGKSSYTPTLATDQYYDSGGGAVATNPSANVSGTPQTLTGKTATAGVANASNATFTAVTAGATINYLILYRDTGTNTTSPLIALIDTATGLPLTTNGGDITIQWDTGANKIFKL